MPDSVRPKDGTVAANQLEFHYREWGDPTAPALLILHGLGGHSWEYDHVAAGLAGAFRVLALDQRGHGASSWAADYSPELMASDLAAVLDALDIERVTVVAHSMGGVNAWNFVDRWGERVQRLVSVDVTPDVFAAEAVKDGVSDALRRSATARYSDPEQAVAEYLADYTGTRRDELRAFVLNNLRAHADNHWTWRYDAAGLVAWVERTAAAEAAHWRLLERLRCPVLLLRAAESPFTSAASAERMRNTIPDARLIEVQKSGHDVHIDQRAAWLSAVREFLGASA